MIPLAEPQLGAAERERVAAVIEDGHLADGPEVRAFEESFADVCGADHAVATSNGTTALHAALRALGIGEGDRVLTTPFSFVATANAARHCGADVGFVDIDPETYALDPERLATRLDAGESVDAVIAVHLYGLPADLDALTALADDHDFALVEDACQAHGATYRGEHVGTVGDVGCFSFYPTKNVTAGEGGLVVSDDAAVAERAAAFVDHGEREDGAHATLGHNFRMTSIAAAIGREQVSRLPAFTDARRRHADHLTDTLDDLALTTPNAPDGRRHVYHQYTVRHPDRDGLRAHLADAGVETGVYYGTPIHEEPAYADVDADCPVAERLADEVLSLPVHPGLTREDLDHIVSTVRDYVGPADGRRVADPRGGRS
ncbi:DegT/DnrJ/EryC1/StrS family aminotransferase [Halarchaeum sp. P4]|uniref:DegT/DnrJ/EryC1/StrS family aminotransferase n=1 Tax=Halarchaeum sp. P4 TaxID=3421639 RepID=UPI003EB73655